MSAPKKLTFDHARHLYRVDGKPWPGASSYGKRIEDGTALAKWQTRRSLLGVALKPEYVAEIVAYQDDDRALDDIAERARNDAGASDASRKGTTIHRIVELADLGKLTMTTPETAEYVRRWNEALEAAGITLDPAYVECVVINETFRCCGTVDRFGWHQDTLKALDLKTGEKATKYPHTYAVQLAIYASADWIAVDGARNGDVTTWTEFVPMPTVSLRSGLIIAMPATGDVVEVHDVDLNAGHSAAVLAMKAREWGATKGITSLITTVNAPEIPDALDEWASPEADPFDVFDTVKSTEDFLADPHVSDPRVDGAARRETLRESLRQRCRDLVALGDAVPGWLEEAWPAGVPGLVGDHALTAEQLDLIAAAVDAVEARCILPPKPVPEWWARVMARDQWDADGGFTMSNPDGSAQDEGHAISDEDMAGIGKSFGELTGEQKAYADALAAQAHSAGRPILLSAKRTERRFELTRTVIACARHLGDDELVRGALAIVLGEEPQASIPVGAYVGALTIDEARRLTMLADAAGLGAAVFVANESTGSLIPQPKSNPGASA